jgi:hypothetical protein
VRWADFAALVNNRGGDVTNGKGSRRRVELNGRKAVFHEPHPKPEIKKKALEAIRDFLSNAGVVP